MRIPTGRNLLALSAGSALLYVFLAWLLVMLFHETSLPDLLSDHRQNLTRQLAMGTLAGILAAGFIGLACFRTSLVEVLDDYAIIRALSQQRLRRFERLHLSLFAGFGEEILFRMALQPLLGIWVVSLLFVVLHGYVKFRSWRHLLFGGYMFALSAGLGLLFEHVGLVAAMAAHAVYDYLMLAVAERYRDDLSSSGSINP